MLAGRLGEIYKALWHLSDDAVPPCCPIYVSPRTVLVAKGQHNPDRPLHEFHEELNGRPHLGIWLERSTVKSPSDEHDLEGASIEELVSLAHERGHEHSKRNGTYVSTSSQTVPKAAKLVEERRAWEVARVMLALAGFERWDAFERIRAEAIASYEALPDR